MLLAQAGANGPAADHRPAAGVAPGRGLLQKSRVPHRRWAAPGTDAGTLGDARGFRPPIFPAFQLSSGSYWKAPPGPLRGRTTGKVTVLFAQAGANGPVPGHRPAAGVAPGRGLLHKARAPCRRWAAPGTDAGRLEDPRGFRPPSFPAEVTGKLHPAPAGPGDGEGNGPFRPRRTARAGGSGNRCQKTVDRGAAAESHGTDSWKAQQQFVLGLVFCPPASDSWYPDRRPENPFSRWPGPG